MAKYTVKYSCGHGEHTVELFGPSKERERKIRWYETNRVCPECYRASKKEEPYAAEVINNMFSGGAWIVISRGDTYSIKETLKQHGFKWMEYYTDALGTTPKKAWGIRIPEDREELIKILEFLQTLGVNDVKVRTDPLTQALLSKIK